MFRGNKSDDESNTKRNRLNDDESSNSYLDNLDRMKVGLTMISFCFFFIYVRFIGR